MKLYQSYSFRDKDPIIYLVRDAVADHNLTYVCNKSGVSRSTLRNWFYGTTRRPQFATVQAVLRAVGKELKVGERE